MAEELSNFTKIVPAPAISLRGDELTTIEACSMRSWSDPGVDITGVFNEAEVELHQEWSSLGPVDTTRPGLYEVSYTACSKGYCSAPATREILVVKSQGPSINLTEDNSFFIMKLGHYVESAPDITANDSCIFDQIPLCYKCGDDPLCKSTCILFHAEPIHFEDASTFSGSLEDESLKPLNFLIDSDDRHSYYCGVEDGSKLVLAAKAANEHQDLSLLNTACGLYDVTLAADDYAGNMGYTHARFLTLGETGTQLAEEHTKAYWKADHARVFDNPESLSYGAIVGAGLLAIGVVLITGGIVYRKSLRLRLKSESEDEYLLI